MHVTLSARESHTEVCNSVCLSSSVHFYFAGSLGPSQAHCFAYHLTVGALLDEVTYMHVRMPLSVISLSHSSLNPYMLISHCFSNHLMYQIFPHLNTFTKFY